MHLAVGGYLYLADSGSVDHMIFTFDCTKNKTTVRLYRFNSP